MKARDQGVRRLPRTKYSPGAGATARCVHCGRVADHHVPHEVWNHLLQKHTTLWRWCPRKAVLSVEVTADEVAWLRAIGRAARAEKYPTLESSSPVAVVRQLIESANTGARRPGSWEASILQSIFAIEEVGEPDPDAAWRRALPSRRPRRRAVGVQPHGRWFTPSPETRVYRHGGRS